MMPAGQQTGEGGTEASNDLRSTMQHDRDAVSTGLEALRSRCERGLITEEQRKQQAEDLVTAWAAAMRSRLFRSV
jgi:hypothetical protein